MNNRSWLWLLLSAALALAPRTATAEIIGFDVGPLKQSHRELRDNLDRNAGEEMMAQRLHELHELHQLQDQIQGLLKDPDFRDNLRNQFSEEQLRRLREKILKGDNLGKDNDWNKLLRQTVSQRKLNERQIDILRRWAERADNKPASTPSEPMLSDRLSSTPPSTSSSDPGSSDSGATLSPARAVEPSFWDKLRDETSAWITKRMDDFGGDLISALTELGVNDDGGPLAEVLRSIKDPNFLGGGFTEEAGGLSRFLPDVGEFLHEQRDAWDDVRSIFRGTSAPSLPGMGRDPSLPSLPATPSADGGWGAGTLALLTLGVLFLLVWKIGGWSRLKAARGETGDWRLGSWPVAPDAVSTRQELIRAFEYLALLCLGPDASTRHHHELADRLAEQDSGDPARRRQAAELLAWLYEQARYAPASESLSRGELIEARHALCLLAGVTTA